MAATCAIPAPIDPAPTIPILSIFFIILIEFSSHNPHKSNISFSFP